MNQKSNSLSQRKFIGDAAAISAVVALGVGAVVSSCSRRQRYVAPVFPEQAPYEPVAEELGQLALVVGRSYFETACSQHRCY